MKPKVIDSFQCLFAFILAFNLSILEAQNNIPINSPGNSGEFFFTENKGQVHNQFGESRPDVLYSGFFNGLVFHIRRDGISYQQYKVDKWEKMAKMNTDESYPEEMSVYRTDFEFIGSNKSVTAGSEGLADFYTNYYNVPNSPGVTNVASCKRVVLHSLYDGIDLQFYQKDGMLEYDFMVEAGADCGLIRMEINGAESISLGGSGELLIHTPFGIIAEEPPIAYQGSEKIEIKWTLDNQTVGFDIAEFDRGRPLVIDPLVRHWGTYYGGSGFNVFNDYFLDKEGNSLIAGRGQSLTNIATSGAHSNTKQGANDAYLAKLDSSGLLLWGTYFGGTLSYVNGPGGTLGYGCAADASSNIYLCGYTNCVNGIANSGFQNTHAGSNDAFLAKFSPGGFLYWSTYFGGTGDELGLKCVADKDENVYLSGITQSTSMIATSNAHQTTRSGTGTSASDMFLAKFTKNGSRIWATYYGGAGIEEANSLQTDKLGNLYMAGSTTSKTGIVTTGTFQSTNFKTNVKVAFLSKYSPAGDLLWATYYGTKSNWSYDYGKDCAIDSKYNVYLVGIANGDSLATAGSHKERNIEGYDAYLVKFDSTGNRLWATYYGDNDTSHYDEGTSVTVDIHDNVYMAGTTYSDSDIATAGEYMVILNTGGADAFLAKFNENGVRQWGSYYGGNSHDDAIGINLSTDNKCIFMGGSTLSTTGIATSGTHQTSNLGRNAFVVKFGQCFVSTGILQNGNVLMAEDSLAASYQWINCSNDSIITGATSKSYTATANGSYAVFVSYPSCSDTSECKSVILIGVEGQEQEGAILISPNPCDGHFTIAFGHVADNAVIEIIDIRGNLVQETRLSHVNFANVEFDSAAGLYLIRITEEGREPVFRRLVRR